MPIHPDEHAAHIAVLLAHDEPVQILYTTSNSIGVEQARTRWRVAICGQPGFSGETELATTRTDRGDAGIWVREFDPTRPGMPEVGQRKFYKYQNIHGVKLLQPSDCLWLSTGVCGHGSVVQRGTGLIGYMLPRFAGGADLQFVAQDLRAGYRIFGGADIIEAETAVSVCHRPAPATRAAPAAMPPPPAAAAMARPGVSARELEEWAANDSPSPAAKRCRS